MAPLPNLAGLMSHFTSGAKQLDTSKLYLTMREIKSILDGKITKFNINKRQNGREGGRGGGDQGHYISSPTL